MSSRNATGRSRPIPIVQRGPRGHASALDRLADDHPGGRLRPRPRASGSGRAAARPPKRAASRSFSVDGAVRAPRPRMDHRANDRRTLKPLEDGPGRRQNPCERGPRWWRCRPCSASIRRHGGTCPPACPAAPRLRPDPGPQGAASVAPWLRSGAPNNPTGAVGAAVADLGALASASTSDTPAGAVGTVAHRVALALPSSSVGDCGRLFGSGPGPRWRRGGAAR